MLSFAGFFLYKFPLQQRVGCSSIPHKFVGELE